MTIDDAWSLARIDTALLPDYAPNRPGSRLDPTKITIHNTGNADPGANADANARYMAGPDAARAKVSWHFTVDDRHCVQSLPITEVAWHCGSKAGNATSIGIEICMNRGIDQDAANHRAALLTAALCYELGLDADAVVQHHHWTGKDCPQLLRHPPENWTAFTAAVEGFLDELNEAEPAEPEAAPWAAPSIAWCKANGIMDGSRPTQPATRQEVAAMVHRLALLLEAGIDGAT